MKKLFTLFTVLALILLFPVSCFAETSVGITELGFSLSVPDNYDYITRDTEESSYVWKKFFIECDAFKEYMEENNIYFVADSDDYCYEIFIFGKDTEAYKRVFNLNGYEDEEIIQVFGLINVEGEELGVEIKDGSVYSSGETKYYTYIGSYQLGNHTIYVRDYITIVNGHYIQVDFRSYFDPFSDEMEEYNKAIIDSIEFDEILKKEG